MADYGMQMPGGRGHRGPTANVYTALSFVSVVALIATCAVVYMAAARVSPESGNPLALQDADPSKVRVSGR
ncbi:MAG: hypothetical protein AAGK04_10115 [Planctomycetota bacterium]